MTNTFYNWLRIYDDNSKSYSVEFEFTERESLRIYDDNSKSAEYKASIINVYLAGAFGVIIQLIK